MNSTTLSGAKVNVLSNVEGQIVQSLSSLTEFRLTSGFTRQRIDVRVQMVTRGVFVEKESFGVYLGTGDSSSHLLQIEVRGLRRDHARDSPWAI